MDAIKNKNFKDYLVIQEYTHNPMSSKNKIRIQKIKSGYRRNPNSVKNAYILKNKLLKTFKISTGIFTAWCDDG